MRRGFCISSAPCTTARLSSRHLQAPPPLARAPPPSSRRFRVVQSPLWRPAKGSKECYPSTPRHTRGFPAIIRPCCKNGMFARDRQFGIFFTRQLVGRSACRVSVEGRGVPSMPTHRAGRFLQSLSSNSGVQGCGRPFLHWFGREWRAEVAHVDVATQTLSLCELPTRCSPAHAICYLSKVDADADCYKNASFTNIDSFPSTPAFED